MPFPTPGDLPDPEIKPASLALAGGCYASEPPGKLQAYWRGLPFPSPVDLANPGIESMSLMSPALASGFFTTVATWEALSDRLLIQVSIELVIRHSIFALCYHVECQDSNYMICL